MELVAQGFRRLCNFLLAIAQQLLQILPHAAITSLERLTRQVCAASAYLIPGLALFLLRLVRNEDKVSQVEHILAQSDRVRRRPDDHKDAQWMLQTTQMGTQYEHQDEGFQDEDQDEEDGSEDAEQVPPGSAKEVKTFYGDDSRDGGIIDWKEHPILELGEDAKARFEKPAICVFKTPDHSSTFGGLTPWKYHAIDIQSRVLISALIPVFNEIGVSLAEDATATFEAPFTALYFCRDEILKLPKCLEACSSDLQFFELLVTTMNDILGHMTSEVQKLVDSQLISYGHVWTLFPPGRLVWSSMRGEPLICEVRCGSYGNTLSGGVYRLDVKYCQFDGSDYGMAVHSISITSFTGNKPITELASYPLEYHNDKELECKMIERGREVLGYGEMIHCEYFGLAWRVKVMEEKRYNITGRIVIDAKLYGKHNLDLLEESFEPLSESATLDNRKLAALPRYLVLMSPFLSGYALEEGDWFIFLLRNIRPLIWNDQAFDHLVYAEQHKDMISTFVDIHYQPSPEMEDVILGKGKGLVVLLTGPPGTGKTLTAEAVADKHHRPLLRLQAGNLVTKSGELEESLAVLLEITMEWKAILLLDEADIFISKRRLGDLKRNELVSVFLRFVEYSQGIMFLTSNLPDIIDEAFESRIHIHLSYPALDSTSRVCVWQKFRERFPKDLKDLSDSDLQDLAAWNLNGRQIKNLIKNTQTWCLAQKESVSVDKIIAGIQLAAPRAQREELIRS